jgi:hypothetical protein
VQCPDADAVKSVHQRPEQIILEVIAGGGAADHNCNVVECVSDDALGCGPEWQLFGNCLVFGSRSAHFVSPAPDGWKIPSGDGFPQGEAPNELKTGEICFSRFFAKGSKCRGIFHVAI